MPDLLENYAELKEKGITPYWAIHHGVTASVYYADPDGNQMEFQVDCCASTDEATDSSRSASLKTRLAWSLILTIGSQTSKRRARLRTPSTQSSRASLPNSGFNSEMMAAAMPMQIHSISLSSEVDRWGSNCFPTLRGPSLRVALIEAGERPPDIELMPVACAAMQLNPATDWMYTADPGKAGLGLRGQRVPVPRGKMLGGSSGLNYMAYVRGHPGDFDSWAEGGADGWSYSDVLPYFRKSEALAPSDEIVIDPPAHNSDGPMGVSVRTPILQGSREFVAAARQLASLAAITTAATAAAPPALSHFCRPVRDRASGRVRIVLSWKATWKSGEPDDHHRGAGDRSAARGFVRPQSGHWRQVSRNKW